MLTFTANKCGCRNAFNHIHLTVCLSVCLSVCLTVCLSVCLSVLFMLYLLQASTQKGRFDPYVHLQNI